ncbi:hypothetical protein E3_0100 [Rhodococcus phage E3]|uniref:hypothetical protein n=1 Tax=Rhodococcus phage E3 TaxID=1007869 RepID=UPI0002C6C41D|nr:hypothetical protein M176_gp010 [Rhodococcus phage E3]AEQ20920.1 hypothetical protein E3_0100 [Rhodococcus phage E3]
MAYTFTEAELADKTDDGIKRRGRCTCHDVQQWAGSHFGSLATLGVACGSCEAINDEYGYIADWNDLTREERIAQLTESRELQERWAREDAEREARFAAQWPGGEPPF